MKIEMINAKEKLEESKNTMLHDDIMHEFYVGMSHYYIRKAVTRKGVKEEATKFEKAYKKYLDNSVDKFYEAVKAYEKFSEEPGYEKVDTDYEKLNIEAQKRAETLKKFYGVDLETELEELKKAWLNELTLFYYWLRIYNCSNPKDERSKEFCERHELSAKVIRRNALWVADEIQESPYYQEIPGFDEKYDVDDLIDTDGVYEAAMKRADEMEELDCMKNIASPLPITDIKGEKVEDTEEKEWNKMLDILDKTNSIPGFSYDI